MFMTYEEYYIFFELNLMNLIFFDFPYFVMRKKFNQENEADFWSRVNRIIKPRHC